MNKREAQGIRERMPLVVKRKAVTRELPFDKLFDRYYDLANFHWGIMNAAFLGNRSCIPHSSLEEKEAV
jgi:hypothetical protein